MNSKTMRKNHRRYGRQGESYRAMLRRVLQDDLRSYGRATPTLWEARAVAEVMTRKGMRLDAQEAGS